MTTIVIKDNSISARQFIKYVRTLPFASILEDESSSEKTFKSSVAKSLLKSRKDKELTTYSNMDEMFNKLGI